MFIAIFIRDQFVRPYVGDFLVVILLYCFIRAFFQVPVVMAAAIVLVFSIAVEIAQYFRLVHYLGIQHSQVASTVVGGSFDWTDILAYLLGVVCILLLERKSV